MLKALLARIQQGHRTVGFPSDAPVLPERFRGLPALDPSKCEAGCQACAEACPTEAITADRRGLRLDLGRCLFCTECVDACPKGAVQFTRDYRLATRTPHDLVLNGRALQLAQALDENARRLFGRSLKLRQVSAGGCNGCEADVNVLNTVVFDLGRFGIQFVASPRHADGVLLTGPVPPNMAAALRETVAAVPAPKLVIAVGACAISGGPFGGAAAGLAGAPADLPVDLYVPGCPPHPYTVLDGLLRLLGRLDPRAPGAQAAR